MRNEYCLNAKNISRELNSLCTNSRGRGMSGCDTYFNSTQFAVYNGASQDYKNAAVVE